MTVADTVANLLSEQRCLLSSKFHSSEEPLVLSVPRALEQHDPSSLGVEAAETGCVFAAMVTKPSMALYNTIIRYRIPCSSRVL